jgi:hypothetical protein
VASSSGPYGYALSIWGCGAVATEQLGKPGVFEALLLMGGAVLGFTIVEALAYGSLSLRLSSGEPTRIAVWGNAHVLSAGGAIFLVWVLLQAVATRAGWALAGFVGTVVYLLVNALQSTLAAARAPDDS